jgi:enediyne biosynthesis protein E4
MEAFGVGCAFLDYDGDGWQDVLLVDEPTCKLFRNRRDGTFEEVTAAAGLATVKGPWKGCAVGDVDADGHPDLLLSGYHRLALLKNEGGARWKDITAAAGLPPDNRGHWGSSAGFMDLDADGTLDLVLLNYVVFGPKEPQYCELRPGVISGCPPNRYKPEFSELWRNTGGGRFEDVTAVSGMKDTHGTALVVAFSDVDEDGRIDFYIGNDEKAAELMRNLGGMRFRNDGVPSGVAWGSTAGTIIAAMGADWADYDGDGRLDLTVTAFSNQPYSLLRNLGAGVFEHKSDETGIAHETYKPLGFGAKWLDMDNDGWPDICYANGHVYDNTDRLDPATRFRQPTMFFHNEHGTRFVDLAPQMPKDVRKPILGRGTAAGDYDNDGRVDLLIVDYEGEPLLLRNESTSTNRWIKLDLRAKRPNRFAYGARVTAKSGERVWVGEVSPASSYLSSSDPRLHFGLGGADQLDELTIRWPSGTVERHTNVRAGSIYGVEDGNPPAALTTGKQ